MRRNGLSIMLKLIVLIKPLMGIMFLAVILGILGFLSSIYITILGATALFHLDKIKQICTFVLFIAIIRGFLRYGEQTCNHYIAFKLLAIIRDKVFGVLRKLCPAKLETKDKGNLISLITSDIELLEVFYAHTISPIIIAFFTSLILSIFIANISPILGLIALLGYSFVGIVIPVINSKLGNSLGMNFRNTVGNLNTQFLDTLRGLREIIQFNQGNNRFNDIITSTQNLNSLQKKLKSHEGITKSITEFSILIFTLLMLITSLYLYYNKYINFENVVIATVSMISSFGPVIALSNLSNNLTQTLASGERVLLLLEEEPVTAEITNKNNIKFSNANFKDVNFGYNKNLILNNVSLNIEKGDVVGIYGKSGCGKSTLLKLLMRFWDITSGKIKISDTNILDINTQSLRDNESYCTQETELFNDSIKENIRLANFSATDEDIVTACKKASLHDFILSLPNGYDTNIGELGGKLSGGEKQRIGIARAFLSKAPLMILDEPTSNLDSLNEGIILKSLAEEKGDKTIIIVSHRKSTLNISSKKYHIENGNLS